MKTNYHIFNTLRELPTRHREDGFIALISAVLISAILLGLVLTTSSGAVGIRGSQLSQELKKKSLALAQSCINIATKNLAQNYMYVANNETVRVDSDTCTIVRVTSGPEDTVNHKKIVTITAVAHARDAWSTIETKISILNPLFPYTPGVKQITLTEWREL